MDDCPKMSTDKRNLAVSWCVDGVKPFGKEKSAHTTQHKHNVPQCSSRSLDLSVLRIESLPGAERSKSSNMVLLQIVTDRQLAVVR
jgi:hypothetical protein